MELNILVGGAAGQGMETVMHMMGKALARDGYKFIATKDYMSRVRGGHNFSRLRICDHTPWTPLEDIDILVALNEETYHLHRESLIARGKVVYDPLAFTLPESEKRGVPVKFKEAAKSAGSPIMANVVAVGALLALLGLKTHRLEEIIRESFAGKKKVIEGNMTALQNGYAEAAAYCQDCFQMPQGGTENLLYMDGNQVLGMAALASGCRFMSAYPMTPATGIMTYLAGKSSAYGLVVEQAEDEIAAINMALGASYGGVRSMTATSGGGFSLMVEGLSLAGMTETPIVIALAMRPGPATGLPTRTEQGDLDFALQGGHGEFPRALLSATTHEDAFYRLNKAFELADKYQIPVIFLSDQNFADTHRSVKPFDFSRLGYNRCLAQGDNIEKPYKRYRFSEDGISPRILPGMEPGEVVLSDSDEHDEKGNIIEDASTRRAMMDKRMKKLTALAKDMDEPEYYGNAEAEILLMGWGSTYGVLRESVDALRQEGLSAALLHFSDLWPLPQSRLMASLPRAKKSFCVENNATGQFAALVRRVTGLEASRNILKYDGRPFFSREIIEEVKKHV
jgi:2-oxoglutarate/2-oxoacid ferredoxin oxidoreductase subunit alpha